MKNFKKQFKLNAVSGNMLRKIEIGLANLIPMTDFSLNKETNILTVNFKTEDITQQIYELIENIDEDIEIEEREIKPSFRKVFILENLDCANCAAKIERIAKRNFEHEFIVVDFSTCKFIIETTDEGLLKTIQGDLQDIASSVDPNITVKPNVKKKKEEKEKFRIDPKRKMEFILGSSIFLVGFIIKTILLIMNYDDSWFRKLIVYLTYIPGYFFLAKDVLYGAFKNITNGRIFDEKFLMSLATIAALAVGYYDEAIFVMVFYKVGELCQQYAVNYSRKSIASLIDIQPQKAVIEVNGELSELEPDLVVVGDIMFINPGERIPLDGTIISGNAIIDNSALTGESEEVAVNTGDLILSGTICKEGNLRVRVTKSYQDSMVSKILNMVENASSLKSKSENFISKFARFYTPIICILAVLMAALLPFITGEYVNGWTPFKESIRVAMIFLVVSCPCALVISIPLSFFGGIGAASKQGILIKGSNYLEALNNVSTIVFDKTGTLTKGELVLKEIVPLTGMTNDEILFYAAYAESTSNHPIAKSIIEAYKNMIDLSRVVPKMSSSNRGIEAIVDGKRVILGRVDHLRRQGIILPNEIKMMSNLFISIDEDVVGYFVFEDKIKEDALEVIKELRKLEIKNISMITGDTKKVASVVSSQLELDNYYAEIDPLGKVEKLSEIKENNKNKSTQLNQNEGLIAYVGDGINDAPVLSRADIGIAMGGLGSDAAIEVADIVLMTDELKKISTAMKIAKKTRQIVIQNIIIALVVKFAFLIIAPLGIQFGWDNFNFFLIYEAEFADVGVSLIAILNALRIMKFKDLK